MSVIAFEPKKFAEIAETLCCNAREWSWAFGYPDGWEDRGTMQNHIRAWAFDLLRANHATYRRQYNDDTASEMNLPFANPINTVALFKSLHSVRYNLVANDGTKTDLNKAAGILDKIIDAVAMKIISELPEYKAAAWA